MRMINRILIEYYLIKENIKLAIEQNGSRGNSSDLCSGSTRFESQPGQ
jgi:hypothetical protein